MKRLIEKLIQLRNPAFTLPTEVSTGLLFSFILQQMAALCRGVLVLLRFRQPKFMLRGCGVSFFHLSGIKWGRFLKLQEGVYISALGRGKVCFGNNVSIGAYSRIIISTSLNHPGAFIQIGHQVGIGEFAYIGGAGGVTIGNDCIIGQYFSCHPENHLYDNETELIRLQGVQRKGINIGSNCWIGSKVTVLDGVTIGNGCVIAAGAVVTKSFPSNSVIGGVPARLLRSRSAVKENVSVMKMVAV